MAPKKQQVSGPRPKRPVRATAKRSASCESFIAVKSPQNGETKTTSQSPPQALRSPPIETVTTPSSLAEVATCAAISTNTVEECGVEEEKRQSSSDGRIGVGKETLAEEDGNLEIAHRIGMEIEEKDSVVVEEMKPKEKKKTKVMVVKVVKKLVKKRVPKSVHKGVAACSNKELATERNFDDTVEKINSGEVVGMVDLSEGFEKQPKVSDSDVPMMAEQEYGKVDSLTSVPIEVENSGVGGSLSGEEAENPDQPVGVCMEVDELKTMGEGGNEVPLCEVPLDGEKNNRVVENFDSASALLMEVVNEDLAGERSNELAVLRSGNEEEGSGGVGEADESVAGNGRIVLSGELEALERQRRRKTEIFIGGLNTDAKEEDVRKVFEEVGEIVEVRLMINGKTGRNKGYAFVRYASADDAKKALEKYPKVEVITFMDFIYDFAYLPFA